MLSTTSACPVELKMQLDSGPWPCADKIALSIQAGRCPQVGVAIEPALLAEPADTSATHNEIAHNTAGTATLGLSCRLVIHSPVSVPMAGHPAGPNVHKSVRRSTYRNFRPNSEHG